MDSSSLTLRQLSRESRSCSRGWTRSRIAVHTSSSPSYYPSSSLAVAATPSVLCIMGRRARLLFACGSSHPACWALALDAA
eukprot:15437587-Alexandrium_andersonii.AAC.1